MPGLEGTSLGPYRLLHRLGDGGMSEVYLAYDELEKREVAVKVMSGGSAEYLERFRREAEAIDKLVHPHILPVFDYDDQEPWHYLVMLYTSGGTLSDRLAQGPLTPQDAGEMLDQVAGALQFAHDHGFIHRDIKPSNILLRDDHYAYLADFGLAKALEGAHELTRTGVLMGTPEYMAPDLAEGPATIGSDIYALGIMLYEMLTGQVPFNAETPVAVYWKQLRDEPVPPSHLNPILGPAIDRVVMRALEKDPHRRFQTAQELADAYRQALDVQALYTPMLEQPVLDEMAALNAIAPEPEPIHLRPPAHTPEPPPLAMPPVQRRRFIRRPRVQPRRRMPAREPLAAPAAVAVRRGQVAPVDTQLPPLPMRETEHPFAEQRVTDPAQWPDSEPVVTDPVQPAHRIRRRTVRRRTTVTSIIVVGLLLFIALPMSYIYYMYSNARPRIEAQRLQIAATQPARAQATATTVPPFKFASGTPILLDNLASNTSGRWAEDATHCLFTGRSYHVYVKQTNYLQPCPLLAFSIENVAAQVNVSLLSGSSAGMLLRASGDQFYDFEINSQGQFFFRRHDTGAGSNYVTLIAPTFSSSIRPGSQSNTLLAVAQGNDFKFYINGTFVGEAHDGTYASGQFALVAATLAPTSGGEASFSNLTMFKVA